MARMIIAGVAMLAVLLAASGSCADARDFYVGGRGGWAPNPVEPFNTWAERNRFQVNDTLVFRYNKDADAVLVVTPSHYDTCNTTQPNLRLAGGDSRFVFNASGPYFFISADAGRCKAGERLIVVVLAVRNNNGGNTPSSPPTLSPPVPPPKSSSSSPPPAATPAPLPEPTPPKSPSSPTSSPPPVATPAPPHALAKPPPAGMNASSPSTAPVLAPTPEPAPTGTNETSSPPSPSSAVALRGGVLAYLLIIGSAILV
ncbi:unnamed protein product [Urochloa humidicola]